ncbi:MAG TPA: magnesium chelatase, partial [Terriglobia bacterium]|nr:magnesium chelatase [Terriglobia bacterium]
MAIESAAVKPSTIGEWRRLSGPGGAADRGVKDEMRCNLLRKLQAHEPLFDGIRGYEETVLPQIANAILARHNFILLGLRGQAKSRILRGLVNFLEPEIPYIAGCEIHDHPLRPICRVCREVVAEQGENAPIAWL